MLHNTEEVKQLGASSLLLLLLLLLLLQTNGFPLLSTMAAVTVLYKKKKQIIAIPCLCSLGCSFLFLLAPTCTHAHRLLSKMRQTTLIAVSFFLPDRDGRAISGSEASDSFFLLASRQTHN